MLLSLLQGAIGVAAEHVYTVLVKKYFVEGIMHAMWFIVGLFFLIFGFIKVNSYTKKDKIITWKILFPTLYMLGGIIILSNINYNDMFMGLINPEYGAINYIMDYTKTMIH